MTTAITVSNLSKDYMLYDSPRARLMSLLLPGGDKLGKRFSALQPLSFEIPEGQTLGIIGRNGSGKSTLLQCLAGILTPSTGEAKVNGTLAALLELGAGFNPDFTGRENLFLNGAILGLSKEMMAAKESEILEFANIGEFIDRPLSTYSSGMVVRLAFAVATAVQPKVLIVDEALSVGDEAFQRKCFRRIEEMRRHGTSILFVSHSTQAIVQLCDRVIWLDAGRHIMDGEPKKVTEAYHHYLNAAPENREQILADCMSGKKITSQAPHKTTQKGHEYPPQGARIENLQILNLKNKPVGHLNQGESYKIRYECIFETEASDIRCGIMLKNRTGVEVSAATLKLAEKAVLKASTGQKLQIEYAFICHLNPGSYFLNCGLRACVEAEDRYLHRLVDALEVTVLAPRETEGLLIGGLTDLSFEGKVTPL